MKRSRRKWQQYTVKGDVQRMLAEVAMGQFGLVCQVGKHRECFFGNEYWIMQVASSYKPESRVFFSGNVDGTFLAVHDSSFSLEMPDVETFLDERLGAIYG